MSGGDTGQPGIWEAGGRPHLIRKSVWPEPPASLEKKTFFCEHHSVPGTVLMQPCEFGGVVSVL